MTPNTTTPDKAITLTSSAVSESFWRDFRALFDPLRQQRQPSVPPCEKGTRNSATPKGFELGADADTAISTFRSAMVVLVCALTLLANAASAQTWQTACDFLYAANPGATGLVGAGANGLACDPYGNLFVAGYGKGADNVFHALIQKSTDGGATWSLVDDASAFPGSAFYGLGLGSPLGGSVASDPFGNLYACGHYGNGNGNVWFTARSLDGGTTWNNVDAIGPVALPFGIGADSAGNVFTVGYTNVLVLTTDRKGHTVTNTIITWLVRKGSNNGGSWSSVDQLNPGLGGASRATAVFCHPAFGVFVTGFISSNGGTDVWTTRRSLDGGTTWTTVDAAVAGIANAIGADASGALYITGNSADNEHWLVRKSSDGGASWATVDDYQPPCVTVTNSLKPLRTSTQCYSAVASGVAADANGNLFVCGVVGSANGNQWVIRANVGGNSTWQTVDSFQYAPGKPASARCITADAAGHVYVAGEALDANGLNHWIVRKN